MTASRLAIVIPARYGSTRLPGKPLADILGKPMIQHVFERALQVHGASDMVVTTDDIRVAEAVQAFGGRCVMTSPDHPSGTDRLCEVMKQIEADVYINLQGDEPLVRPADIVQLAQGMFADSAVQVGTLCHPIDATESVNPNTVKVVLASNGDALYFSRSPIPYPREADETRYLKHVGVYAYRCEVLADYSSLSQPMMEKAEKLEQLRLLAAGMRIRAYEVAPTGPGVDTPECLKQVRLLMSGQRPALRPGLDQVKLVITDVDGVLTDGGIYYDATGECLKRFHVRDGRDSATLRKRVDDLGVTLHQFGVKNKAAACRELMKQAGASMAQTVCIGDDSIDLPAFKACGLSYAVADAPVYVKSQATHTLSTKGGEGAFRELDDAILTAQDKTHVFGSAQGFATVMAGAAQ